MKATFNNLVTVAQQINEIGFCKYTIRVYRQCEWYNIGFISERGEEHSLFGMTARECMNALRNIRKFYFIDLYGSR